MARQERGECAHRPLELAFFLEAFRKDVKHEIGCCTRRETAEQHRRLFNVKRELCQFAYGSSDDGWQHLLVWRSHFGHDSLWQRSGRRWLIPWRCPLDEQFVEEVER